MSGCKDGFSTITKTFSENESTIEPILVCLLKGEHRAILSSCVYEAQQLDSGNRCREQAYNLLAMG